MRESTQAKAPAAADPKKRHEKKKGIGHFFAIDRRAWAQVCRLGMNAAVAYLVLARGTGRNNVTTGWSVHAICVYTSISRSKARRAIATLIGARLVVKTRGGSRPRYRIAPWPGCVADKREKHVLAAIAAGRPVMKKWDVEIAARLVRLGLVIQESPIDFKLAEPCDEPAWIWLPNEVVSGAASETPPLERVRQTQDPMTLRLFIDLYGAQNLREDGGIARSHYCAEYTRVRFREHGQFVIWGFRCEVTRMHWTALTQCHQRLELTKDEEIDGKNDAVDFFRRMAQLVSLGLVEIIPYLVEGESADAELIHPYGTGETDSLEDQLGGTAAKAASALLWERDRKRAEVEELLLVPVPCHIGDVQMIGIARLRYRPRTRLTSAWWGDMHRKCSGYLKKYRALGGDGRQARARKRA